MQIEAETMETLGQIIKELRDLGMTQAEIAEALRLSQAYISGIERGKRGGRTPAETLERAKAVRDALTGVKGGRRKDDSNE